MLDQQYAGNIVIRDVEASGTMRAIYCAMIDRIYDEEDSPEPGYEWLLGLDANTAAYAANPTDMYQRISRQEAARSEERRVGKEGGATNSASTMTSEAPRV